MMETSNILMNLKLKKVSYERLLTFLRPLFYNGTEIEPRRCDLFELICLTWDCPATGISSLKIYIRHARWILTSSLEKHFLQPVISQPLSFLQIAFGLTFCRNGIVICQIFKCVYDKKSISLSSTSPRTYSCPFGHLHYMSPCGVIDWMSAPV